MDQLWQLPNTRVSDGSAGRGQVRTLMGQLISSLVVVVLAMVVIQMGIASTVAMAGAQTATADADDTALAPAPSVDRITTTEPVQTESTTVRDIDRTITTDTLASGPAIAPVIEAPEDAPPVLVILLGYSSYHDSDPLEHEARQRLYEAVAESPGTYVAQVAETTGISVSTTRYHLRILENEQLLRTEKVRGKRRLYRESTGDDEVTAALNDGATAAVVEAVTRHEPASVSQLADVLGRARSTVTYHVQRLDEGGVLTRERDGESVRVGLTPATRAVIEGTTSADD